MLMGDIIRILYICMGALWIDELYAELSAFRRALGEDEPDNKDIDKALDILRDSEIIEIRPAIKATTGEKGVKSKLVKLLDIEVYTHIHRDPRYIRYRSLFRE